MAAPEWMAVPKDLLAMQRTLEQVSLILKVEQIAKQWGPCIESEQQVVMCRIIVSVERQPYRTIRAWVQHRWYLRF
jgi:hypothetical protein